MNPRPAPGAPVTDDDDDDHPTDQALAAECAAARERLAGPEHDPVVPERFARAVTADGFRGDVPVEAVAADDGLPPGIAPGARVTAKRAGWDERLDIDRFQDLQPYAEAGHPSDHLAGPLAVIRSAVAPGGRAVTAVLVGGQEADPTTVAPAAAEPGTDRD